MGGALDHGSRGPRSNAARVLATTKWTTWTGFGRSSRRPFQRRCSRGMGLHTVLRHPNRTRSSCSRRGCCRTRRCRKAGDLRWPRRALCRGMGRAPRARRNMANPRHHESRREKCFSRNTPTLAWFRRASQPTHCQNLPRRSGRYFGRRM